MALGTLGVGQFNEDIAFSVYLLGVVAVGVHIGRVLVLLAEVSRRKMDGFLVSVSTSLSRHFAIVDKELLFARKFR